ncbi:hypothetical protein [Actinoplanes sp. NPDC020271]
MKRQMIAIGVAGVFPLIGVAVAAVATVIDLTAVNVRRRLHR